MREAKAAAALAHPNIVGVFEAGEMPPILFIASEYCSGGNLAQWLRRQVNQPGARLAARIMAALAEAVAQAHERGILHRDLKLGNVLLQPCATAYDDDDRGEPLPFVPKITDFGLAKIVGGRGETTNTGLVFGTARYMAPEQARGEGSSIGPAADVYSLGAILYELLVGRPPFIGDSELDTLRQIQAEDPIVPTMLRPGLPRDLEAVCLKCLEKDPPRRYATARELADRLAAVSRSVSRLGLGRQVRSNKAGAGSGGARSSSFRLPRCSRVILLAGFAWHKAAEHASALTTLRGDGISSARSRVRR